MVWLGLILGAGVVSIGLAQAWPVLTRLGGRLPEYRYLWRQATDYRPVAEPGDGWLALAEAAEMRAGQATRYDPSYLPIDYPAGDVPADQGVCSDLVIRSLRDVGVDLQRELNEDMVRSFDGYPALWGAPRPDPNIDHRRVPNLMTYLERRGLSLPLDADPRSFQPGEIIAWRLPLGMTHIGIVTANQDPISARPLIAHHVSGHPAVEDVLLRWPIIGRYRPPHSIRSQRSTPSFPQPDYPRCISPPSKSQAVSPNESGPPERGGVAPEWELAKRRARRPAP